MAVGGGAGAGGAGAVNADEKEMTAEARTKLLADALKQDKEGEALYRLGRPFQALQRLETALAMKRKLYPADKFPDGHTDLAESLNNLGVVLRSLGRREGALEHYQQALAMRRKLYPPTSFPTATLN